MTNPAPTDFTMPAELVQRILNYLISRPYGEVHQLVAEVMQHNKPLDPKPEPEDES